MKHSLSAVVICKNEEANIARCLKSLQQVSDDIIVIDSFSSDHTAEIARAFTPNVHKIRWSGYGVQKNIGNLYAKHDYILSLDADEVLSDELIASIQKEMEHPHYDAYEFVFLNRYCGKPIRHGGWKDSKHVRLFKFNRIRWNDSLVHEKVMTDKIAVMRLNGYVNHYTASSRLHYRQKMKLYASRYAEAKLKLRKFSPPWKKYASTLFRFVKEYIIQLGFLDGKAGLLIATEEARYTFIKYKLSEKTQLKKDRHLEVLKPTQPTERRPHFESRHQRH